MRFRFALLALAPAAITSPAFATTYLSVSQAQALMFPGATLVADQRTLTDAQANDIQRAAGVSVATRTLHAWRSSDGGWFIVDQVIGKHELITFALALDTHGTVRDLEILEYRESYGFQIRDAAWRRQFVGASARSQLRVGQDIQNISGASLSSRHVTEGVRRLLATYAVVLSR
ncbi:MAG: FMN-binding protein [Terricaulis sp.]